MDIELKIPYEKRAIGQLLGELAKGEKWRTCIISVETNGPGGKGRFAYHNLRITGLKAGKGRFDLVLEPAEVGPMNFGTKNFFWPGEADEDHGGRKPILGLTVWATDVGCSRLKRLVKRVLGR